MLLACVGGAFGCWLLWILWKYRKANVGPLVKITLNNQAEQVEGLVRQFCHRHPDVRLELVDTGSTDDTPAILSRLARQYGFSFVTETKRYNASGVE